jgi:vancomycin resistance protein YoaR
MTTTTDAIPSRDAVDGGSGATSRRAAGPIRFLLAFLLGLGTALGLGAAALYAYGASYENRILPGVRVGSVDLGGLSRTDAAARLMSAYASLAQGSIVLAAPGRELTVRYDEIGRRADVDAMVAEALGVGRDGTPLERAVAEAQTAVSGVDLSPRVAIDAQLLSARVSALVAPLQREPTDATIAVTKTGFTTTPAATGTAVDGQALAARVLAAIGSTDTPATVRIDVPITTLAPSIGDDAVAAVRKAAEAMVADLALTSGKDSWTLAASTVRSLVGFVDTADGRVAPTLDSAKLSASLKAIAKKADQPARNATFLTGKGGAIVGVAAGSDGRALDVPTTAAAVTQALNARAAGTPVASVAASFVPKKPAFTTDDARKTAPLMKKISSWTTYFPINDHNGFGANIWIPALTIDGTVVGPGETFDFWKAVGPVTRAKGYKDGGAIIDGHTEPQGALAGGICSCSTTLFNAALRAGFDMLARKNHYYYIDRYPLGLDATVFISASGATQTMSWRNDTKYPVLIRGLKIRNGSRGYVRFDLYSVPNGRQVSISAPVVKNVRPATDTVQRTASLPAGVTKRVEYPVDGKDVWRTVTVRENGKIIHQWTYYSHYSRITGVLLVGTGGSTSPSPSPSPSP